MSFFILKGDRVARQRYFVEKYSTHTGDAGAEQRDRW